VSTDSRKLATDPQELAQLLVARANVGDVDGMVELYEPDAVLAIGGDKIREGRPKFARSTPIFLPPACDSTLASNARRC